MRGDPFYTGLPRRRARGKEYDALVAETIAALRRQWGASLLVHFEDFASRNSYRLLARYREEVGFETATQTRKPEQQHKGPLTAHGIVASRNAFRLLPRHCAAL